MSFEMSKKELAEISAKSLYPLQTKQYKWQSLTLSAKVTSNSDTLPLIVFIHGSPGSWDAYAKYLTDSALQNKYQMIALDRPGYGLSDKGNALIAMQAQAAAVKAIIEAEGKGRKPLIVGHSLGGTIAARYAMDYPLELSGVLLLASALSPEAEKIKWYNRVATWKVAQWVLPTDMEVSNLEMYTLSQELLQMEKMWEKIQTPVTSMHGKKDMIADYQTQDYIAAHLPAHLFKRVDFPKENHFIPWTQFHKVVEEIDAFFE